MVRQVISVDDPLFELTLPSKGVALATNQNPDAIRKQIKRTFTSLKPILEPFNDNDLRTSKSWKCEIAAIVLAAFGKVNKIQRKQKPKSTVFLDPVFYRMKKPLLLKVNSQASRQKTGLPMPMKFVKFSNTQV